MTDRLKRQPSKGKLVEEQMNKLSALQSEKSSSRVHHQPTSTRPSFIHLQNGGSSRVKKLSKLFEENSSTYHTKPNWWLEESARKNSTDQSSPKPRNSISRTLSNSPKHVTTKFDRIVHEFLLKEKTYIDSLERGIANYVDIIKRGGNEVPALLRRQTFRLFANIEEIYKLHKESVYPRLLVCNGNAQLIAETISSYVQNDLFYCYIVYGVNQKSAETLISQHLDFFDKLRYSSDDMLGITSLTIQPIQKLPRYKMLFDEMIKELGRDIISNKAAAAACCIAEKNLQRLLVRLDEALSVNDIIEVNTFGVEEQMNTITSLQNQLGLNINEPILMIIPKASTRLPYRSPVTFNRHKISINRSFYSNFRSTSMTWGNSIRRQF